jgi:hypothetical protein
MEWINGIKLDIKKMVACGFGFRKERYLRIYEASQTSVKLVFPWYFVTF